MRINKYLSHNNYCSRREADDLIEQGRVFVNGQPAKLGQDIADTDNVTVEGLDPADNVVYAYYKPTGIVTVGAQEDEQEITDITKFPERVSPVGRLDKDSEGLIILTNDGRVTTKLLGSDTEKEYAVTVDKPIEHSFLVHMRNGVKIKIPTKSGKNRWYTTKKTRARRTDKFNFEIILTEGKNRQIRRMCAALGYGVENLKRFRIGDITLDDLQPGEYRKIK